MAAQWPDEAVGSFRTFDISSTGEVQEGVDERQVWDFTFEGDPTELEDEVVAVRQHGQNSTCYQLCFPNAVNRSTAEAWVQNWGGKLSATRPMMPSILEQLLLLGLLD